MRLSLVLAYLDWAVDGGAEPREITVQHFGRAAHLVEAYVLPMARRAYAGASMPKTDRAARRLVALIREQRWERFTTREVLRRQNPCHSYQRPRFCRLCRFCPEGGRRFVPPTGRAQSGAVFPKALTPGWPGPGPGVWSRWQPGACCRIGRSTGRTGGTGTGPVRPGNTRRAKPLTRTPLMALRQGRGRCDPWEDKTVPPGTWASARIHRS